MDNIKILHILASENCDQIDLRTDYGELIIDGPAHRFLNHGLTDVNSADLIG